MYREEPDNDFDSGWRFLSGLESDAYVNDLANVGLHGQFMQIDFEGPEE